MWYEVLVGSAVRDKVAHEDREDFVDRQLLWAGDEEKAKRLVLIRLAAAGKIDESMEVRVHIRPFC